jgi:diguanylate cyclase (GGDEF)-like protein
MSTAMYLPYLMYGYAAAVLLMLVGCGVSASSVPGLRGIALLGWGYGAGLAGVVLLAMRPFAPAWATIILANEALFVFSLLLYCATAETLEVPRRFLPWGLGLMGTTVVVNGYYTYAKADLTARILVSSLYPAICAGFTAWMLLTYRESAAGLDPASGTRVPLNRALGWLQVLLLVQHGVRCLLTVSRPPGDILHLDLVQAGYTYTNMLLNIGAGCGLIWLSLCMQRRDLHTRAQTDGLTGLLNRRAFEELLGRELARSCHDGAPLSLLLMDIDRFKQVNDAWGHQAGDEVICRVSRALRDGTRPGDALSRFGGEEFLVLLRDTEALRAREVAERLRCAVAGLTGLRSDDPVTVSIGVAGSRQDDTPADLLRRCDEALYQSKRGGRNLVSVAGPEPGVEPAGDAGVENEQPAQRLNRRPWMTQRAHR